MNEPSRSGHMQHVLIPDSMMPMFLQFCRENGKSLRSYPISKERHGNSNVVMMPCQFGDGPEAA